MTEPQSFQQSAWQLGDVLTSHEGPEFEQILADLEARVVEFEGWRERLSPDLQEPEFVELLDLSKSILALANRLGAYGALWFSADTQSQDALNYRGQIEQRLADVPN
jgi:oligoendopeptidase F